MNLSLARQLITITQTRKRSILIIGSIVFLFAAVGYSLYLGKSLPYPDERWYYNDYAQNIVKLHIFSRDGIHPTAFNPPAYPLFLGLIVSSGFGILTARLMNFVALFLSMACLFLLLENQSHKLASILAVLLALGYPVLFYTAGTLYSQTFGTFFFVLAIFLYWKTPLTTKNALLGGISLGIATLTIPTFLYIPFFLVLFTVFIRKDNLVKVGLLCVMVFVTIAPWTLRNYLILNRFTLISTNFGGNFLLGNSPLTSANNGTLASIGITDIVKKADLLGLDEVERDRYYSQQALAFIQEDPKHYVTLYILKVINYFNYRNELLTATESGLTKDILMLITYGLFLVIACVRILLFKKFAFNQLEIFLMLLYTTNAFVSAVAFTRIRFRLPYDYLLIAFIAIFLEKIFIKNQLAKSTVKEEYPK